MKERRNIIGVTGLKSYCIIASLTALSLSACVTLDDNTASARSGAREVSFGLILIKRGAESEGTNWQETGIIGAWIGKQEAGIGVKKDTEITANADCQLVFFVRNKEQYTESIKLLESTLKRNGEKLCIESLPRN